MLAFQREFSRGWDYLCIAQHYSVGGWVRFQNLKHAIIETTRPCLGRIAPLSVSRAKCWCQPAAPTAGFLFL